MNSAVLAWLGYPEVLGILVVVLILFGAKKLPELARGLGSGIKEFKKATREVQDDLHRTMEDDPHPAPPRDPAPAPEPKAEPGKSESGESKAD